MGKSVFFASGIVTFFFAQVMIGKFAVFKGFSAQTAANTANKPIHSLPLACCIVHEVSVGDFFNVTVYMLLIDVYQARNDKIRKTCRFKVYIAAINLSCEFFDGVVSFDVICDISEFRLKRLGQSNLHFAARLHFFAAFCDSNVKYGNFCAVIRLVDCQNSSLALLTVGSMASG